MLTRTALFSFTLIWMSSTAACIAVMTYLGHMPLMSVIDVSNLSSSFLHLILNAVVVVMSTLLLKRFEFKFSTWYLIPLGYMLILYSSSLYVINCFLSYSFLAWLFLWLSLLIGIVMAYTGMHFFAKSIKLKETLHVGLAKRKIFIISCFVVGVTIVYFLAKMTTKFEVQTNIMDMLSIVVPSLSFASSIFLSLLSLRIYSLVLSAPLEFFTGGMLMFGLFSLASMLYRLTSDLGLKLLSQAFSIVAPLMMLTSIFLVSKFEAEILDAYGVKPTQSILFEVDPLSAWPSEVLNNIKRHCKGRFLVLVTRPASILASQVRSDVIALTDSSSTYPQHLGGGVYKISPEATYILNFINRVKKEYSRPMCLILDSLTDIIATLGVKEGYRIARDILSLLGPDDVAIFVLFPKAHDESEVALMRTLFAQRVEIA